MQLGDKRSCTIQPERGKKKREKGRKQLLQNENEGQWNEWIQEHGDIWLLSHLSQNCFVWQRKREAMPQWTQLVPLKCREGEIQWEQSYNEKWELGVFCISGNGVVRKRSKDSNNLEKWKVPPKKDVNWETGNLKEEKFEDFRKKEKKSQPESSKWQGIKMAISRYAILKWRSQSQQQMFLWPKQLFPL